MPYTHEQIRKMMRVHDEIHHDFGPQDIANISELLGGYKAMFTELCGHRCSVETATGTQYSDFAHLARHRGPVFCTGSSYCLWAAYANTHGPTYVVGKEPWAAGMKPPITEGQGAGFVWIDQAALR